MPTTKTQPETLVLELNPSVPLKEQVRRGNYGYTNPSINSTNFALTLPAGEREVILYDPDGPVSIDNKIIARMKNDGFVPATLDDALAMGQQYPERQRTNPIAFLGMVRCGASGFYLVPILGCWEAKRGLYLGWFGLDCKADYLVAAVREA